MPQQRATTAIVTSTRTLVELAEATRRRPNRLDRKLTISGERPVIESTRVSARASKRGLPFLIPEIAPAHFGALDGYWVNGYLSNHSTSRDSLQVAGAALNMPANQSDVRNRCAMISRTIPNVFVTPQSRDCGRKKRLSTTPFISMDGALRSRSQNARGRMTLSFTQLGAAILTWSRRIILTTGPSERSVPFRRLVGVVQRAAGTLG